MAEERISLNEIRDALSEADNPWQAGTTSLSSLSLEEQKRHLGATPPPGEPTAEEIAERALEMKDQIREEALSAVAAPAAFDWRNVGGQNYVTPIKNQSSCGSCVAFGTTAAVETTLRKQRGNPNLAVDLSEAHLFFCHARARGRSCSNGWWPNEALDDFRDKGVADEACYPYNLSNTDCSGLCSDWASRTVKITGYTALTSNPAGIKEHVSTIGPVSACFVVYQDFFSYTSGVYRHVTGGQAGGHCVAIIGYDDSQSCWICKNSWATGWGEQGFFRIAYGECGIETWLNHGVNAIQNTGWQSNQRVVGLWTIDQDRNAWVYFQALGWRRISPDNDNIVFDMLAQLSAAKAAARPVTFYEESSVIKQVYVY
jgi:C1A family cysteine protease